MGAGVTETFYHGTSVDLADRLLPPEQTGTCSERGRARNLDRVFFTRDLGYARIYAGRAAASLGGSPRIYRVVPEGDVVVLSARPGASVYHAPSARIVGVA